MALVDSTFGAALIGLVVGACLYGITLLQTYLCRNYANDTKTVKSLTILHRYLITNFANADNLDITTWYLQTDCNGLIGLIVEVFFARRVRNWLITGIIVRASLVLHAGLRRAASFAVLTFSALSSRPSQRWVTCLGLGSAAASDILIAGAMCYYLYMKRTGLKRHVSLLTRLAGRSSGILTTELRSVIATVCVITFAAMPTNFVWLSFFWVMGKCYVNSFLALLNSRESLRDKVAGAVQLNKLSGAQNSDQPKSTIKVRDFPQSTNCKMSLRDKLLAALADLPGTRTFHIHVLTSAPRKHNGLFPYAHPRPRTYLQDVFILLSEQTSPDAPRVLVTAIEASVYNIPATSSGVLYVSKVDSSGHASTPSPTATLVRAFLTYYADPVTRPIAVQHLWIQLFARAQNQYLFPNSSEYEGKRPLSDVKLCAWWKRVYSDVAADVDARLKGGSGKVRLYYILPGYSELEAAHSLSRALSRAAPSIVQWAYGHPYSQTDVPLPCPQSADADAPHNLGHYIPWFDDDPKSRFIDEIAYIKTTESGVRSPKRKRPRAPTSTGPRGEKRPLRERDEEDRTHGQHKDKEKDGKEKEKDKDERPHIQGELGQVTADEFWERMSFRQECVAGAVTGFFTLCVSTPPPADNERASQPSPLAPQPGQVSSKMVQRVVASLMHHHEFSTRERALRATETLEGAIKGLCDDAPAIPAPAPAPSSSSSSPPSTTVRERPRTPEPRAAPSPEPPRTPPPKRLHLSAGGKGTTGAGAGAGAGLPEISPNPFPDPVPSPETYTGHIYGSIEVRNPPLPPRGAGQGVGEGANGAPGQGQAQGTAGAAPVTLLAVRKKRKPPPA
ncbi:histone acetylation protein-domain-containing protein [Earliella scabrosa]|nr:histone acetylation protein-domain-containing protein [Earliella scabrosa]